MTRSRLFGALVAALVVVSGVGAVASVGAADDPAIQVSSVSVTPEEPEPGESVTVDTTIENLQRSNGTVEVTAVYLRVSGSAEEHQRIDGVSAVAPNGEITVPMPVTFESPGEKRLTVFVGVEDDAGDHETYEYPVTVDVVDPEVRAGLTVRPVENESGRTAVELTNYGNTNLTGVELSANHDGEVLGRSYLFDVAPESSRSATFETSGWPDGPVRFAANYDAAGESHATTRTVNVGTLGEIPGEIRLTGVEPAPGGAGLTIQGEAANIGSTDAESVLLRVENASGVEPAAPAGEYFVGTVEASEFATFELSADAPPGTSSIPVEMTYIVDDDRVTTTRRLEVGGASAAAGAGPPPGAGGMQPGAVQTPVRPDGGSGGLLPSPVGIVLVVLVVAGVGYGVYRWRR